MSVDEFDPEIERLFARTPAMPDAAGFTARVESRLQRGGRFRVASLVVAGLVGGVVAVRETMGVNINVGATETEGVVAGHAIGQGLQTASVSTQNLFQSGLDQAGLSNVDLSSMGGMQLFWIAAGLLIAVAAAGVMRLSQDI
ncbi:MAG: hypothetical protein EON90_01320 [Brevundimonas sp.]|nr:MAG: hypothetical protein EON90_01320 [Brevundimonas sp.]